MAKFVEVSNREGYYLFDCPGCKCSHFVNTNKKWYPVTWKFNGDLNKPTVSPSLLIRDGKTVCHSFIKDGNIQFLGDCTHELKNKTVPLPEFN